MNRNKKNKLNIVIICLLIILSIIIVFGMKKDNERKEKDKKDAIEYRKSDNTSSTGNDNNSLHIEDNITNAYNMIKNGQPVKMLIVGDSVGKSIGASNTDNSWDSQLKKLILEKYKSKVNINNISEDSAIAYKGYTEIMQSDFKDFDIAIVCFGSSDQYVVNQKQFSSTYDTVIRQLKKKNHNADIITVLENNIENKEFVKIIKSISDNYKLDVADIKSAYEKSGISVDDLISSNINPNDKGYKIYADAIFKVIDDNILKNKNIDTTILNPYDKDSIKFDEFSIISDYTINKGFTIKDNIAENDYSGAYMEYKTTASDIGISYADMQNGGIIKVYVNGEFVKQIDTSLDREVRKAKIVVEGLEGENTIRIKGDNGKVKIFGVIENKNK